MSALSGQRTQEAWCIGSTVTTRGDVPNLTGQCWVIEKQSSLQQTEAHKHRTGTGGNPQNWHNKTTGRKG